MAEKNPRSLAKAVEPFVGVPPVTSSRFAGLPMVRIRDTDEADGTSVWFGYQDKDGTLIKECLIEVSPELQAQHERAKDEPVDTLPGGISRAELREVIKEEMASIGKEVDPEREADLNIFRNRVEMIASNPEVTQAVRDAFVRLAKLVK